MLVPSQMEGRQINILGLKLESNFTDFGLGVHCPRILVIPEISNP